MHNLALAVALTELRRRQCPCGAMAEHRDGLCRKCQARNTWRRKAASNRRKSTRRRTHRTRSVASFFAGMFTPFSAVRNRREG